MSKFNYERAAQRDRLRFVPSPRSKPSTQKQLDYILALIYQKGQPRPRLPKTQQGASDMIERLRDLPNVNERRQVRLAPEARPQENRQEVERELRERFPSLTPMTVNSLLQLCAVMDEVGSLFILDEVMADQEAPSKIEELVPYIMRRLLEDVG